MLTLADELVSTLLGIRGVEEAPSQFTPVPALWIDGREFVNLHSGVVYVRLGRRAIGERRAALRGEPRVELRSTDWIGVRLRRRRDLALIVELARAAVDANHAAPGERRGPVPDDAALARRRRSHRGETFDLDL